MGLEQWSISYTAKGEKMKYLVSLSGGKDSTACLLWALDNIDKDKIIPYYMDTKWEHDSVYEYLEYLEKELDIKITRIESEGMEALCERKRMMPNRIYRFCSENLKKIPATQYLYENFYKKGIDFINIIGKRRDESPNRANTEIYEEYEASFNGEKFVVKNLNPIAYWNTQKVFDYLKSHNIEVNPLYKKGFSRVGCYPCIFARKYELVMMEDKYKKRLRDLEEKISKLIGKDVKFFVEHKDKQLSQGNLFGGDLGCVNQFGICE